MVMSQGTYTFLVCFAGFWLVWAVIVMLCCFCNFLQRRLKLRHEERLREQCLRSVEMEPLRCHSAGYPPGPPPPPPPSQPPQLHREPPQFGPPQTLSPPLPLQVLPPMPQATRVSMSDPDIFAKPPCYEDAVLMDDPPPPYSQVLSDPRGGTYFKPAPLPTAPLQPPLRDSPDPVPVFPSKTSKPSCIPPGFPERGYSSLTHLPSSQCWDSLGHLLSNVDLNHNVTPPAMAATPRREPRTTQGGMQGLGGSTQGLQGATQGPQEGIQELGGGLQGLQGVHGLRGLEPSCGLPTAFPLLGRSTAV